MWTLHQRTTLTRLLSQKQGEPGRGQTCSERPPRPLLLPTTWTTETRSGSGRGRLCDLPAV